MYKAVKHKEVEGLSHLPPQELKIEVQAWLASFNPLIMNREAHTESEVMQRLGLILELKKNGPLLKMRLGEIGDDQQELADTFSRAWEQLPSLENDTRLLLGEIRQADPRGLNDLDARQAITPPPVRLPDAVIEEISSPAQIPLAVCVLFFALGTLAFLTFHMTVFVSGMTQYFGSSGYLVILLYACFYLPTIALLFSAFEIGAEERITLSGRNLKISRKIGPISTSTLVKIALNSVPRIGRRNILLSGFGGILPRTSILLADVNGREVSFGTGTTPEMRERLRGMIGLALNNP